MGSPATSIFACTGLPFFQSQHLEITHQFTRTTSQESKAMSRPPVHTIRMGFVKASIWRNETKFGLRHQVTVCRLFKNGDMWQESTRFGRDDLPLAAKILELAHEWIFFHSQEGEEDER